MDSSSEEEEELDYIQLIPYESYPFEKARHRITIKWLLSRAYGSYKSIPEELREPFYEDDEGLPHLKPPIVKGLSDAELYTKTLYNIYKDPNYANLSPWGVVQLLTRKGVYLSKLEDGSTITETVLIQSCPLRIAPHLLLIESLQQLFIKETMYGNGSSDYEEALITHLNGVVMGVKEIYKKVNHHHHFSTNTAPQLLPPTTLNNLLNLQPYQDLSDLSDGVGLCLLLSKSKQLEVGRIVIPSPGMHLNVAEALTNLQLFMQMQDNIFGYEDLLYMDKTVRQSVVCLLAEIYNGSGANFGSGGRRSTSEVNYRDITPTKRKNLDTNPGIEQSQLRKFQNRTSETNMVVVPLHHHESNNSRRSKSPSKSINSSSCYSPPPRGGTTTSRSHRGGSSPPRSLITSPAAGHGVSSHGNQYPSGHHGPARSHRSSYSPPPPVTNSAPQPPQYGRKSSTMIQYTSTSSSSSGEFQVQSRKRTPTLLNKNHAAGLPSASRIQPTVAVSSEYEESITGRKRISRSNSLTEIDSQLTIENFGGGGSEPPQSIQNVGMRRRDKELPIVQDLYSVRPHRDLFATRDIFGGEEPIDRLKAGRESSLSSDKSLDYQSISAKSTSHYAVNNEQIQQQQQQYSMQQQQPKSYYATNEPPNQQQQQYSPILQQVPPSNQQYYSLPRDSSSPFQVQSPPSTQIYYSPQHQHHQHNQQHLSSVADPAPINIVYLGGSQQPSSLQQQSNPHGNHANQNNQDLDPDLVELEQIEDLRRKLEEKRLAIERLRMKRLVHGGNVARNQQQTPTQNSFHLHSSMDETDHSILAKGPPPSRSFHLHDSTEQTQQQQKSSFYLSSSSNMTSSDPTAVSRTNNTTSFYIKPDSEEVDPIPIAAAPVPPPRSKRQTPNSNSSMEPQSISFVQEPTTPRNINSGTKTYRILQSTPESSLSSSGGGGRPSASGLFPVEQQEEDTQSRGGFFIELDNTGGGTTHSEGSNKENYNVQAEASKLQMISNQDEDLLEKKKQRILLQSLRRQQEAEELKRRKEEELERKRELELDRLEQARRKKEEERVRREKILEGYRQRKGIVQEEEQYEAPATSNSNVRMRPKSSGSAGQRPKSIHTDYNVSGRLQRSDSNSSLVNKYGQQQQQQANRSNLRTSQQPPPPSGRNVWGSTNSLNKYGRFGVMRANRFGGSARSLVDGGQGSGGGMSDDGNNPGAGNPPRRPTTILILSPPHNTAKHSNIPLRLQQPHQQHQQQNNCPSSFSSSTLNTTKQFQTKSNRLLITNAIEYSIFPGHVNHEQKSRILEEISNTDSKYFLVLFRDAGLQFRGLYAVDEESEEIVKLYGTGPRLIRDEMFDLFYKYNSGSKQFTPVHTKHLTVTIDAFTIQNSLWQAKKGGAGQRPGSSVGGGIPGRDY